jgi:hypothetical protein
MPVRLRLPQKEPADVMCECQIINYVRVPHYYIGITVVGLSITGTMSSA